MSYEIIRGNVTVIGVKITDPNATGALLAKRVTLAFATAPGKPPIMTRSSGVGATSAEMTLTEITAGQIKGEVPISLADYSILVQSKYAVSLWIDDGAGAQRCVTPGGSDVLNIVLPVARA